MRIRNLGSPIAPCRQQAVTLILNYPPDEQQSMSRFGAMLADSLTATGIDVRIWTPPIVLGHLRIDNPLGRKWLAYIDKFLLGMFSLASTRLRTPRCHWHIVDHSNAGYMMVLPADTTITCHDCIAIEDAFHGRTGESVGPLGPLLQRWIVWGLKRAHRVIAVSSATADDLRRLVNLPPERSVIVHNGMVARYSPQPTSIAIPRLNAAGIPTDRPFIFMIGSNLIRKNRLGAINIFNALRQLSPVPFRLVLAGKPWSKEVAEAVAESPWGEDIIEPGAPLSDQALEAAYSAAKAVIFPSLAEGFGLPIIEGQACGALVITSNIPPMPEVGGIGAYYADPRNPTEFAQAILAAIENSSSLRQAALENVKKFSSARMAEGYKDTFGFD